MKTTQHLPDLSPSRKPMPRSNNGPSAQYSDTKRNERRTENLEYRVGIVST